MKKVAAFWMSVLALLAIGCSQSFTGKYGSDYIDLTYDQKISELTNDQGQTLSLDPQSNYTAELKLFKNNVVNPVMKNILDKSQTAIMIPLSPAMMTKIESVLKAPYTYKGVAVSFDIPEGSSNLRGHTIKLTLTKDYYVYSQSGSCSRTDCNEVYSAYGKAMDVFVELVDLSSEAKLKIQLKHRSRF